MPKSLKRQGVPRATSGVKKLKLPPPESPESLADKDELEANCKDDNHLKNQHALRTDSNGVRGERHVITCVCCGKPKYEEYFYINRNSAIFTGIWNRVPVCRDCLESLLRRYSMKYEPLTCAAMIAAILDMPYNKVFATSNMEDGALRIGNYTRGQNLVFMKDKTFIDSINSGEFFDTKDKLKIEIEKLWEPQDKKNKKYVIGKFGYDPFDSFGFEDLDYRNAFNITAKYLEDESILQDAHKMQSLITMVATIIQSNKVEALLTNQYKNIKPDVNEIKTLTATKKDLQATISKLAEDNNISSKFQKENKAAQSHLTAKMKEMANAEYWEAKPNMFDVRTSAAMRQVADLSHQSILEQLELSDSDFAQMVKEQRTMIKDLQDKCDRLEEENRNLTNKFIAATIVDG